MCPQITQITQICKEDLAETDGSCRGLAAEQIGDLTIAAPGGKPDFFERERSSQPCCPPDDAPGARQFRLAPLRF